MAEIFELNAQARTQFGKAVTRRARRLNNHVPAVIYGAGQEPASITLKHHLVTRALQNEAFASHILTLKIDGKAEKVILKAVQRHPFKPLVLHMDFLRIKANEKLNMHIPLHFINEEEAPGVKKDGGVVTHNMSDVEVSCLPADLPSFIEVDLANIELGGSIHLSQLTFPKGVECLALSNEDDRVVVSIHAPKVQEEPETPETEILGEGAEGEEATVAAEGKSAENAPKEEPKE